MDYKLTYTDGTPALKPVSEKNYVANNLARGAFSLFGVFVASRVLHWSFGKTWLAAGALRTILYCDKFFVDFDKAKPPSGLEDFFKAGLKSVDKNGRY